MTLETRSDFARRTGMHKSSITRAAQAGNVIMHGGMVDVERSLALLDGATGNTANSAPVRARHEATREAKREEARQLESEPDPEPPTPISAPAPALPHREPPVRQRDKVADALAKASVRTRLAQMRRAEAEAGLQELKLQEAQGSMLSAQDVTRAWAEMIRVARGRLLALPQRVAPDLLRLSDLRAIELRLTDAVTEVLSELAGGSADGR